VQTSIILKASSTRTVLVCRRAAIPQENPSLEVAVCR